MGEEEFYLGLDVSTQSCKAIVIDHSFNIVYESRVHYDTDFPEYKTQNGVYLNGNHVTSPVTMWFDAIKLVLHRLKASGCPMDCIVALSGSGQQHGSVYLKSADSLNLKNISDDLLLPHSPIWMDTSTTLECQELEEFLGGEVNVRLVTGSAATERFTGHHIAALRKSRPELFQHLRRVCLVSSFCASLLCGKVVSIDKTDAAGMNLLDIRSRTWHEGICQFIGREFGSIESLLGELVDPWCVAGSLAKDWIETYGFKESCQVVQWSGDNPCAIVGMGLLSVGDMVVSLGTSDTCIFVIPTLPGTPPTVGHIFPHPILPQNYFGMFVYSNGDITRRKVRDQNANGSWEIFDQNINNVALGRYLGSFWTTNEITPAINAGADLRMIDGQMIDMDFVDGRMNCRAVIEYRALSMLIHAHQMMPEPLLTSGRLLLTGGASISREIRQIFADVFQKPLVCLDMPDAAAYGAAIRAYHGTITTQKQNAFLQSMESRNYPTIITQPNLATVERYNTLQADFKSFEDILIAERKRR